jgi:hypothetical protein
MLIELYTGIFFFVTSVINYNLLHLVSIISPYIPVLHTSALSMYAIRLPRTADIRELTHIISEQFVRGAPRLSLSLEDCVLPDAESVAILRDNETIA